MKNFAKRFLFVGFCCLMMVSGPLVWAQGDTGPTSVRSTAFEPTLFEVEVTGQGRPVLLIPGLMSDARTWATLRETFAAEYELHLINIKGFGQTPSPLDVEAVKPGWLAQVSEELVKYIHNNDLENCALIGHSMGGFLAMNVALQHPMRVSSVVSVDGLPYFAPILTRNPNTQADDMHLYAQRALELYGGLQTREELASTVAQGIAVHATSQSNQQWIIDMNAQSDSSVVAVAVHDLLLWDLRKDLSELTQPLLVLGATGAMPDSMQEQAASLYAQQLEQLPPGQNKVLKIHTSARHFLMLDDPDWLTAQIKEHLQ